MIPARWRVSFFNPVNFFGLPSAGRRVILIALTVLLNQYNGLCQGVDALKGNKIAFPIGGIGAGMFALEGSGAISHFSIFHNPAMFDEPPLFAAITIKGDPSNTRVIEGPVPGWKKFGLTNAALGNPGSTWGLRRYAVNATFSSQFPFAKVSLHDAQSPVQATITGWSPFIPSDPDNSSLPVGALEYTLTNTTNKTVETVFSYSAKLFDGFKSFSTIDGGFILTNKDSALAIFTDAPNTVIDYSGFRGTWFDPLTMAWKNIETASVKSVPPQQGGTIATLATPVTLPAQGSKTIRVYFAWYVPHSKLRFMQNARNASDRSTPDRSLQLPSPYHMPWYASKFKSVNEVAIYWRSNYDSLKQQTLRFTNAFYASTLPKEVTAAVAANLSILKSPTVLRQYDGRFWAWEGCEDNEGSCPGSCTHVWNYAQALAHLFPSLERSMRATEFGESQDTTGHQMFRSALPIRPLAHNFYAAADGQLGGIMKVYRDWRIAGNTGWIRGLYPKIKKSLDYCIHEWDPNQQGIIEEPHHNTYDIEFWGPEPMCTGMYLGALQAFIKISIALGVDAKEYTRLFDQGKAFMESKLFNGSYFEQKVQWTGLKAADPVTASKNSINADYSDDAIAILRAEGPRYQYGRGVLSDGMIGAWMSQVCGLASPVDKQEVLSHLSTVFNNNFKTDLSQHSNPQRSTYALGSEGGLLLCTWPKGGKPSLPFPYSDEVWTGIEYEVASHLIMQGKVKEGLQIVRTARKRYDGSVRNPFDEYECGHFYARAMSSYALIQALTGVRYDAVDKTLYVDSRVGDFVSFLSTDTGFGNVIYKKGKASVKVAFGTIDVQHVVISASSKKYK